MKMGLVSFFTALGFLVSGLLIWLNPSIENNAYSYPGLALGLILFAFSVKKLKKIKKQKLVYELGKGAVAFFLSMYIYFFIIYILTSQ